MSNLPCPVRLRCRECRLAPSRQCPRIWSFSSECDVQGAWIGRKQFALALEGIIVELNPDHRIRAKPRTQRLLAANIASWSAGQRNSFVNAFDREQTQPKARTREVRGHVLPKPFGQAKCCAGIKILPAADTQRTLRTELNVVGRCKEPGAPTKKEQIDSRPRRQNLRPVNDKTRRNQDKMLKIDWQHLNNLMASIVPYGSFSATIQV